MSLEMYLILNVASLIGLGLLGIYIILKEGGYYD